jgi:ankyrin repeat protein
MLSAIMVRARPSLLLILFALPAGSLSAGTGASHAIVPSPDDIAMIIAASTGNLPVLKRLIDDGLDVDHHDFTGNTPLIHAARYARVEMVDYLLQRGADVNASTHWGTTALKEAVRKGSREVTQALLDAGADVNEADDHDETPLFDAVRYRRMWAVNLLLGRNARVGIRNDQGRTPLAFAAEQHQPQIAAVLRQGLRAASLSAGDVAPASGPGDRGRQISAASAAP